MDLLHQYSPLGLLWIVDPNPIEPILNAKPQNVKGIFPNPTQAQ